VTRDRGVKAALRRDGVAVQSFPGHVLHEPWAIERGGGGPYRVFTPFWRALASRQVGAELMEVVGLAAPEEWPRSENLADWGMGAGMARGATVVADHVEVGEAAAQARLARFLDGPVDRYKRDRDRLDRDGTSGLSENLTYGEISARSVWNAVAEAATAGASGAEAYLRQLAWRDFAWHLMYHAPEIATRCWRCEWEAFPWREDNDDAERWRRGMTGEPLVDAAMRQLYVTGTMHNRARMVVASYLTKHLLTDWRVGMRWFAECLIDWDPASNALGWQWVAGCGPDAAPYFRVFNPVLQAQKFDPDGAFRRRFVAQFGTEEPEAQAAAFYDAVPRRWALERGSYPDPVVDLKRGREAALAAYEGFRDAR
jgi:deoxyribodipyrimidine photo-lyase